MNAVELNLSAILKNRKFLTLFFIALLVTDVLPFPLINGFLQDYSKVREIREQMARENDAIVCHRVLNTDPDFFGSHGMKCNEEYYRPNEKTVGVDGLVVYEDTYWKYLKAKKDLRGKLPDLAVFVILGFISLLWFSYALIDFMVGLARGNEKGLLEPIISGLHSLPALVGSEILVFLVMFLVLILLAIPIAIFGPLGGFIAVLISSPAFALVVPVYYFTKNIPPFEEIWRVVKGNTGGYFTLGFGVLVIEILTTMSYHTISIGSGMLFLLILVTGALQYLLWSLGALWVYLDTPLEEKRGETGSV